MRKIMQKEIKLAASPLSFIFILFGLMFFLPGYPVLCGVFFITLGIYQSFQNWRESNDILFSALLPISKCDIVRGKYIFVCFIELCGAILMGAAVLIRMTLLSDVAVYRSNALMNANLFALGMAFVCFGLYNLVFVGGYFKTAYKIGKPFIIYTVSVFLVIGLSESLHHFPGLEFLNAFKTDHLVVQISSFIGGVVIYALFTYVSYKKARKSFEKINL